MIWVMLGLVALLILRKNIEPLNGPRSLNYSQNNRVLVIRSTQGQHQFDDLGVTTTIPQDWVLLAVADDVVADTVTFVNPADQVIVRFQRWNDTLLKYEPTGETSSLIRWLNLETDGPPMTSRSGQFDRESLSRSRHKQWRFGHWSRGGKDLLVIVLDLQSRTTPPRSVGDLLNSIR